eukprot:47998_1
MNSKTSFVIISALYLLQTTKSVNDCSDECDGHPDYWKACEDVGGCSKCTPCAYVKPWPFDIKSDECKVVTIDGTTHCVHKSKYEDDPSVCEYCWECPLPIFNAPGSWKSFGDSSTNVNWLYSWTQRDDLYYDAPNYVDYDAKWGCESCTIDFILEGQKEKICKDCKEKYPDPEDIFDLIKCIGEAVEVYFEDDNKCKVCFEHAGAMLETLVECGITGANLVSHWYAVCRKGHSWLEIDIGTHIIYADSFNGVYVKKAEGSDESDGGEGCSETDECEEGESVHKDENDTPCVEDICEICQIQNGKCDHCGSKVYFKEPECIYDSFCEPVRDQLKTI